MDYSELFTAIGILIATIIIASLAGKMMSSIIKKSAANQDLDPTNYKFLKHTILAAIYVVGIGFAIASISSLRTLGASLLAGAGMLTIVIGFASQQALSNVVAGIFIVIFKPFRINDRITIKGEFSGIVEDINLRHTVIKNFESKRIIVPNSVISNEIVLNSDFIEDKICKWIDLGISYESDIDLAKSIIADEIQTHRLSLDNRTNEDIQNSVPIVMVRVTNLGEYSITIRGWAWAANSADGFVLHCDVLESIKKRFDKENIEIPYPHRTIVTKGA